MTQRASKKQVKAERIVERETSWNGHEFISLIRLDGGGGVHVVCVGVWVCAVHSWRCDACLTFSCVPCYFGQARNGNPYVQGLLLAFPLWNVSRGAAMQSVGNNRIVSWTPAWCCLPGADDVGSTTEGGLEG